MTDNQGKELLISKWFPITEVSVESLRERSASNALPPLYFLHVWFARRPLAASRAAVLGSILPDNATREQFLNLMGIPHDVDLQKAQDKFLEAKSAGIKLDKNPFFWRRAFEHIPTEKEIYELQNSIKTIWNTESPLIVDPMAGGGSIPFEAMRIGLPVVSGDLNPVAFICLKGTLEYPARFGRKLVPEIESFCKRIEAAAEAELAEFFLKPIGEKIYAYLWTRTIKCASCGLEVPLSPNWWTVKAKKDEDSIATNLVLPKAGNECSFQVVTMPKMHSLSPDIGTVKGGRVECPRCHTVTNGNDVKREAQNGRMGHQLYCVCTKQRRLKTVKKKWVFRTPTKEEIEAEKKSQKKLEEKMPEWLSLNLLPTQKFPQDANDTRPIQYGMFKWSDMFSSRQLLTHLTYLEKFRNEKIKLLEGRQRGSEEWLFAEAILTYAAMVFDTCVNYNCLLSRWHSRRTRISPLMELQAFPFKWTYAEWDHSKMLWPWALSKVTGALEQIIELQLTGSKVSVYCGTSMKIPIPDNSVPCVVVDPPYAENVMYAEMSDFFYVWLRPMLSDVFPSVFEAKLTDKEEEAVSNPARFKGIGKSAKKLSQEDYKTKMEACFKDMSRILRDDGAMTIMFTHRTAEAWNSLAVALMNANFTFVSSWPIHTEPSDKLGKKDKGILKVTILLTCRKRKANRPGIWEHIIEELREVATQKIEEFSMLGISGPDLKVSVYGPVLGRFANYYPVRTATGKEITPKEALDIVTDVLNERFLQEAGIQNADKETAAYINLIATFPSAAIEYEEARLATVFGGGISLDKLDIKGVFGLIEKKGKMVKILSARERQAKGTIDPYETKTLKTIIDFVHAALMQYEKGGLVHVKRLMQEKNLEISGSPFPIVLQAYARYSDSSSDQSFQKDSVIAKALLAALGKSIDFAPKQGEKLDHYVG